MRILGLLTCFFFWNALISQSYFFNTQQFGLQSNLLGGAVIAGGSDLSMAYYNPAALRYAKGQGFDLALFMPSLSINNYGNYFNNDENLRSQDVSLNPSLIVYKTNIERIDFVFSVLQKERWENELAHNEVLSTPFFDKNQSFRYQYKGDERWLGISTHIPIAEGLSFGYSQFWSIRSTDYQYHISSEVIARNGSQFNFFDENLDMSYSSSFSFISKLGLTIDQPKDRLGLVMTTPNYLARRNSGKFQRVTSSLSDEIQEYENIADFELEPDIKNGWQVDLGYARILPDSSELWISANFITGINQHPLASVNRVQNEPLVINSATSDVVNFSIGHARFLSPGIKFLGSIRTNFNAFNHDAVGSDSDDIIVLEEDRLHLAAGCRVRHNSSSFVIGLDYGFAIDKEVSQFDRLPNIELFDTNPASYGHQSLTILLTYQFFLDSMSDNISRLFD